MSTAAIKRPKRARWYMGYVGECPVCGSWQGWKEARYTKPPAKAKRYEQLPQTHTYDNCLQ